jgi:alkanesulfonate monooxygenase SsuD/methylene tetrahydromethanopterin reductase-like flavin-dependent oxidoreductase (luciferase family)
VKLGISLPIYNTPLAELPGMAAMADEAEFDSVWSYEVYANPYTVLATAALATSNIALGTGLATASTRHPMHTANQAADVDQLSNGRMLLGLGAGDPELTVAAGVSPRKPLSLMSEYIDQIRLSWDLMASREAGGYSGDFFTSTVLPGPPVGPFGRLMDRTRIPIYLAALRPKMLQLAGEKTEGALGCFYTPGFTTDVVLPNLEIGAARTGRSVDEIDIVSYMICSIHEDHDEAYRRARIHVGTYAAWPGFDFIVAHEGLEADQAALRQAVFTQGMSALETATSDRLVDRLSLSGTPDEVRDKARAFEGIVPHLLLHPPAIPPLSAAQSRESFEAILTTFGRAPGGGAELSASAGRIAR